VQEYHPASLLRERDGGEARVTPLELFFDLVFVFAVTRLSHRLLEHLTVVGALETLFLLLAVWWAWIYTIWFANWFDPDRPAVRALLVTVMLASLFMSVAIPDAFAERGLMFAAGYVAIQVGRTGFAVITLNRSLGASHPLSRNFQRILVWFAIPAMLWVAGGLLEGETRYALWGLALALESAGPAAGFWTPGLGRSTTEVWNVEGGHIAERCQLFIIVALGESIIITGSTFADLEASTARVAAFVNAFLGSAAFWWIYFSRHAEAAREAIASSEDPGRLARSGYTYFHLPMVAGIIAVAASDEITVAHPGEPGTVAFTMLVLGGTALFLAGQALFKWAISDLLPWTPWSRVVAIAALAALAPVGGALPALALSVAATLVVVGLAVWDTVTERQRARSPKSSPREHDPPR
jgi:low temperature requirement protein LtrA